MTPNKQVSPVIRISQGERDASARATHLEAATRKFLVTTNERKQMSTKTNFKRIALVAVAALGMGVLSSVPSQATVTNLLVTKVQDGTRSLGQANDTTTAAIIAVTGFATSGQGDSITVTFVDKGVQPGSAVARMLWIDTATGNAAVTTSVNKDAATTTAARATTAFAGNADSKTASSATVLTVVSPSAGYLGARFAIQVESTTAAATAGTYNYTALVTSYTTAGVQVANGTVDFAIVVSNAGTSTTIAPASTTAVIAASAAAATTDEAVIALGTASATAAAGIRVRTYNAAGNAAPESVTATITGAGLLNFGSVSGASLANLNMDGDDVISILPDGRSGVATITLSTTSRTLSAKSMTFYATAPATLVASVSAPVAGVGTNSDAVRVTAKDSTNVDWAGTLYIYASSATDALVAGAVRATAAASAVSCTWTPSLSAHVCPVTGTTAGTAKFKVSNYATAALATAAASGAEVTSNEVTVTVGANAVATVKLEFDKATYAPGERARIYVTPLDSAGKALAAATYANLLATGGISTASALTFAGTTTTADSLTAVSITTKANSSSTSGAKAGSMEYTVYMPVGGGTVTISATGGSSLPVAARVAVTASATVTDSGAAALAAVNALATTVASLRTLITTLTNLVLKIQKKVKA
jgi:hypothetical protein